jgi:hypothetical protein
MRICLDCRENDKSYSSCLYYQCFDDKCDNFLPSLIPRTHIEKLKKVYRQTNKGAMPPSKPQT